MNKIRKLNTVIWGSEEVYCPLCKSLIYADEKLRVCEHLVYRKSRSDSKDAPEYDKHGYFDKMKETYNHYGYQTIEVPKTEAKTRADFVLKYTGA